MRKKVQQSDISLEESAYQDENGRDIKSQQIRQLIKTKQNFSQFITSLGPNVNTQLSAANSKYSKQILQGNLDVSQIVSLVQNRVDKMVKNHKIKKNWCKQDCTILAWVLERLTNGRHLRTPQKLKSSIWDTVANVIPGSTPEQCMFKWLGMKKIKLGNNKWSETESKVLQRVIKQLGSENWKQISRQLYYQNPEQDKKYRHPKQCREQWNCYLNPSLKKGPWSVDEDLGLLKFVQKEGRKWSIICKKMVGRTQNALKNRYNFLIQHKKDKYPNQSQQNLLKKCLIELQQTLPLSNSNQKSFSEASPNIDCKEIQKVVPFQLQQINPTKAEDVLPQHVTIVQCNYEQLTKFIRMNHILIPARIERNELISFDGQAQRTIKIQYTQ